MDVPIIQCHGNSDPLVSPVWGRDSHNLIKKYNPDALFKNYPGLGHSSSPQVTSVLKHRGIMHWSLHSVENEYPATYDGIYFFFKGKKPIT